LREDGPFPDRRLSVVDCRLVTVLDAMTENENLSLEVQDNETKRRAFALVILKMLTQQAGLSPQTNDLSDIYNVTPPVGI